VRAHGDSPRALVEDFHRRSEAEIAPWYHAQIATDRMRFAEMEAIRDGRDVPPPASDLARRIAALMTSLGGSPDLFRDGLEYIATITPVQEILARPEVIQRLAAVREAMKGKPRLAVPGPDRTHLLQILSQGAPKPPGTFVQ
jgi:hypothetical protein